jgi:hypothetical protein
MRRWNEPAGELQPKQQQLMENAAIGARAILTCKPDSHAPDENGVFT